MLMLRIAVLAFRLTPSFGVGVLRGWGLAQLARGAGQAGVSLAAIVAAVSLWSADGDHGRCSASRSNEWL